MPYASPRLASLSGGKVVVTTQFATHCAAAAIDSAAARIRFGNFSPSMTQTTGPHDIPKKNTNAFAATRATGPAAPCNTGVPVASSGAVPKITAMTPSVTVMPSEPISSSGLRPTLSIVAIAIRVVTTFTTLVITVIDSD